MNGAEQALDGWTENQWVKRSAGELEAACLVGRLVLTVRDGDEYKRTVREIKKVVLEQYGDAYTGMGSWNDAKERTFSEVVAVLEKAATRLNETTF